MTIHISIPENVDPETARRAEIEAREAVAISLYRDGNLSHGQLAKFLGIGRGQVDAFLTRHGITDEFTADEIAAQAQTLHSIRRTQGG